MDENAQWIVNLPERVVGGFTPAAGIGEGWVAWTWETEKRSGTGLAVGGATPCEPLTLDLDLHGPHRLFVGVGPYTTLRVRLDGMSGHRLMFTEHGGGLEPCELWVDDLTGKRLHIANEPRFYQRHNVAPFVAYILAVPDARPHPNQRNIVGTEDGTSFIALYGYDGPADMAARFEALRDSDVGRMLVSPGGADISINPHTEHGTFMHTGVTHSARHIDRQQARGLRTIRDRGDDPLRTAADCCRELGIEFHFYIRVEAFAGAASRQGKFASRFFEAHPAWRCQDEHGDEISRMSYAFPGVQDHMLDYFEELMQYEPDGLCLAMNRSLPMILFEEPVLEEFERRYGRRPSLPEEAFIPDMLGVRHDLLQAFIGRLYELYGSRGKALSFIAGGDDQACRRFGLDMRKLIETGWISAVYGANARDSFWQQIVRNGSVEVYPGGRIWGPAHDHAEIARYTRDEIFANGFDGVFFWDIANEFMNPYDWHVVRRLGTRSHLDQVIDGRKKQPVLDPLLRVNGVKLGPYSPSRSY